MTAMQGALSAAERSMRSVFVGNIPYEATEEQLKDIFAEVGPVVSFRLVYDRETGKPKGYGFCEYKDQEMALSAMRNLNGYELNGRALRVDNAASEKSKEELKNLQASLGGPPVESPYGPEVPPDQATDVINKVMASLAPEQLYELMVQMKESVENNPHETRILLMQNPQLTYALLQAQVLMKIITPDQAKASLHKQDPFAMPASALLPTPDAQQVNSTTALPVSTVMNDVPTFTAVHDPVSVTSAGNPAAVPLRPPHISPTRPSLLGDRPMAPANSIAANQYPDQGRNQRALGDHDLRQMPIIDRDMRAPPLMGGDKDMRHPPADEDFRAMSGPNRMPDSRYPNTGPGPSNMSHGDMRNMPPGDMRNMPPGDMRNMPPGDMRNMPPGDIRNMPPGDMRNMANALPGDMRNMPRGDIRNMPPNDMQRMPQGRGMSPTDSHGMQQVAGRNIPPMESRNLQNVGARNLPPVDARGMPMGDHNNRGPMFDRPPMSGGFDGNRPSVPGRMDDLRNTVGPMSANPMAARPQNPRITAVSGGSPAIGGASPNPGASPRSHSALAAAAAAIAPNDSEKAALIMQVLLLSDQQIAMLPPEQRQSILVLKEQIARTTQ